MKLSKIVFLALIVCAQLVSGKPGDDLYTLVNEAGKPIRIQELNQVLNDGDQVDFTQPNLTVKAVANKNQWVKLSNYGKKNETSGGLYSQGSKENDYNGRDEDHYLIMVDHYTYRIRMEKPKSSK